MSSPLAIHAAALALAAQRILSYLEGGTLPPETLQRDLAVSMARVRNALKGAK